MILGSPLVHEYSGTLCLSYARSNPTLGPSIQVTATIACEHIDEFTSPMRDLLRAVGFSQIEVQDITGEE